MDIYLLLGFMKRSVRGTSYIWIIFRGNSGTDASTIEIYSAKIVFLTKL